MSWLTCAIRPSARFFPTPPQPRVSGRLDVGQQLPVRPFAYMQVCGLRLTAAPNGRWITIWRNKKLLFQLDVTPHRSWEEPTGTRHSSLIQKVDCFEMYYKPKKTLRHPMWLCKCCWCRSGIFSSVFFWRRMHSVVANASGAVGPNSCVINGHFSRLAGWRRGKQTEQCDFRGAHLLQTSPSQQNTGYKAGRTSFLCATLIVHLSAWNMQCHVCPFKIHHLNYNKDRGSADIIDRSVNCFFNLWSTS